MIFQLNEIISFVKQFIGKGSCPFSFEIFEKGIEKYSIAFRMRLFVIRPSGGRDSDQHNTMDYLNLSYEPFFRILDVRQGLNKQNEIRRLVFEIMKKYRWSPEELLVRLQNRKKDLKKKWDYRTAKQVLIEMRYPESFSRLKKKDLYLPVLRPALAGGYRPGKGPYKPGRIFVEKNVWDHPLAKKVLRDHPDVKTEVIPRIRDLPGRSSLSLGSMGKDDLYLVEEKVDILKSCPCSRHVHSCGYWILNIGFGCGYDCSYCYLQQYGNAPGIILPVNMEMILKQLSALLAGIKKPLRIGTGEFTDSLFFDPLVPYTEYLIPFFSRSRHCLELKTKSVNIDNLLKFDPVPSVVISWSVNAPSVIRREESGTPDLSERLTAMKTMADAGWRVGVHFDPIVYFKGWEDEYRSTVVRVLQAAGRRLAWISLGALRFNRTLKPVIEQRFPDNRILDGEIFLDGPDGKMRYPEKIRARLFSRMVGWIREVSPESVIYLCMEPEEMTLKVLGSITVF